MSESAPGPRHHAAAWSGLCSSRQISISCSSLLAGQFFFTPKNSWQDESYRLESIGMTGKDSSISYFNCVCCAVLRDANCMASFCKSAPVLLILHCARLAENEEIKGGKVRVLGLPRDPPNLSAAPHPPSAPREMGSPACSPPRAASVPSYNPHGRHEPGGSCDASFEQVLADLRCCSLLRICTKTDAAHSR